MTKKKLGILGSTGSIGTQALEVVSANPESFVVELLTAQNNADLLIEQAMAFRPAHVVIGNEAAFDKVKNALRTLNIKVSAGVEALNEAVESDKIDTLLTALVGYAGLLPTIKAIRAGKNIALANKETLVVAGELVTHLAREKGVHIYPVDSEHSAIFQCLAGEDNNPVEKIILTASGGPFRGQTPDFLKTVTKEQALRHPNWSMGAKITIDSATMMNKGLEVIEAKWLFGLRPDQIEVLVHPQSIVHSMVQFTDGSIKAQLGLPDMKLPIQYALTYPRRVYANFPRLDFSEYPNLSFEKPDLATFRNLAIAFDAMEKGGNAPCIINAANEVAVAAFLEDRLSFARIPDIIETCLSGISVVKELAYEDYVASDSESRSLAAEAISKY